MSNAPEMERLVRARPAPPADARIDASASERVALAERFGVSAIHSLRAECELTADGDAVEAHGTLWASVVQPCAVSGDDFAVAIEEPLHLRFVPQARVVDPEEEAELPVDEPDEIEFSGDHFDLGEAVAQSLGLAIDPYAEGPDAEDARREAGIAEDGKAEGPLAELLRGLKPN